MKVGQKLVAGLLLLAAALVGCSHLPSVGPDYAEPGITAPEAAAPDAGYPTTNKTATGEFRAAQTNEDPRAVITDASIRAWWNQFNDDALTNLVAAAVSNNLTFLMAQERLVQARWALVGSAAAFMPKVTMDGTYTRSGAHRFTSSRAASGTSAHGDHWASGFDATWEIDLFGGSRRAYESADAALAAAEYTLEDAWVTLTSEIGREYISLRTTQERLRVARANLKLQSETYDILKSRLDSGIGDELAVNQAKYNVEQTRASIPNLLAAEEKYMNALAILSGTMPGALHALLGEDRDHLQQGGVAVDRHEEARRTADAVGGVVGQALVSPDVGVDGTGKAHVGVEQAQARPSLRRGSSWPRRRRGLWW